MIILVAFLGLILPRITIVMLWFFSGWFNGVFETRGWPILGFLFMPLTLLWYSVVANWHGGMWEWWHVVIMVLAVLSDIGSSGKSAKR